VRRAIKARSPASVLAGVKNPEPHKDRKDIGDPYNVQRVRSQGWAHVGTIESAFQRLESTSIIEPDPGLR
jgi:hypothetical protein